MHAGQVRARSLAALLAALLAACAPLTERADPASDAPESPPAVAASFPAAATWEEALAKWRSAEDVNAWIGARFRYDLPRAMALSESQRQRKRLPIHAPAAFFASPSGVCVDLARFGVEALRAIDPASRPRYLMIEFDPVTLAGNTLRRHWVAVFERGGEVFVFADSKRPGHLAGPYAGVAEFIADYARYRGRRVVAFRELDTFERRMRTIRPIRGQVEF
ncbi:MAG: hypothetical protein IPH30_07210 [Betaproteobacteria bacterium]|nr:hypothetical protein [Betaproteobacteria bacterium]